MDIKLWCLVMWQRGEPTMSAKWRLFWIGFPIKEMYIPVIYGLPQHNNIGTNINAVYG